MIRLSAEKIELATNLYDYIDEPTEELEKDLSKYFPQENSNERKGHRSKKNRYENGKAEYNIE